MKKLMGVVVTLGVLSTSALAGRVAAPGDESRLIGPTGRTVTIEVRDESVPLSVSPCARSESSTVVYVEGDNIESDDVFGDDDFVGVGYEVSYKLAVETCQKYLVYDEGEYKKSGGLEWQNPMMGIPGTERESWAPKEDELSFSSKRACEETRSALKAAARSSESNCY